MKRIITTIVFLAILLFNAPMAQEVAKQLNEAHSSYNAGKLQETRFALQQALNEIDLAIGAEILKILPTSMGNMQVEKASDNVTSAGSVGLMVSREFISDQTGPSASIQIIGDSPLMAGVNAILSLPMFVGDANQKRIRVGSYRALLQRSDDGQGSVNWDISVPMGSTLLTFNVRGIADENTVTTMANAIKLDEIARLTR